MLNVLIKMLLHVWKKLSINFYNVWFYLRLGWFRHFLWNVQKLGQWTFNISIIVLIYPHLSLHLHTSCSNFPLPIPHQPLFTCFRRVFLIRVSIMVEMLCIQVSQINGYLTCAFWFLIYLFLRIGWLVHFLCQACEIQHFIHHSHLLLCTSITPC